MTGTGAEPDTPRPTLLCFDGSENAAAAIAEAGGLVPLSSAVVLSAFEPPAIWEPYDPASILGAPVSSLASKALGLEDIAKAVASKNVTRGIELAAAAGFAAEGRIARGKPWRVICDVAQEIGAAVIVMGARGLSRIESMVLGSVSAAVVVHAGRPVLVVPPPGTPR